MQRDREFLPLACGSNDGSSDFYKDRQHDDPSDTSKDRRRNRRSLPSADGGNECSNEGARVASNHYAEPMIADF